MLHNEISYAVYKCYRDSEYNKYIPICSGFSSLEEANSFATEELFNSRPENVHFEVVEVRTTVSTILQVA